MNPLVDADRITSNVADRIDVIEARFNSEIRDGMQEILDDIARLRAIIPEGIHACVNDSIGTFNNTAFDLIGNLNAC